MNTTEKCGKKQKRKVKCRCRCDAPTPHIAICGRKEECQLTEKEREDEYMRILCKICDDGGYKHQ